LVSNDGTFLTLHSTNQEFNMLPFLFFIAQSIAGETADIQVTVKGMVCSFCVQGLEKTFGGESSVEKVTVNLDDSLVSVWLKDELSLADERIQTLVNDSGYNVDKITRTPPASDK